MDEQGEKCVRCGEVGEDRRTLWMACFYEMAELGLPFDEVRVRGTTHELDHVERKPLFEGGPSFRTPVYREEPDGPARDHHFYTLRVCKSCRSDWMQAIKSWHESAPDARKSVGSGIFVRKLGKTVEITQEEWDTMYANRPVGGG